MRDSIAVSGMAGIPDIATRVTLLVAILFVLSVTIMLLYFKLKEVDKKT